MLTVSKNSILTNLGLPNSQGISFHGLKVLSSQTSGAKVPYDTFCDSLCQHKIYDAAYAGPTGG